MKHKNSIHQTIECLTIWLNARKFNQGKTKPVKNYDPNKRNNSF